MDGLIGTENLEPEICGGPTVDEVHIDFLLEEEFSVDPEFLRKFVECAAKSIDPSKLPESTKPAFHPSGSPTFISAVHSVSDSCGEADLVVLFRLDRLKIGMLIEDKIHAPFQPDQAKRYHDRGLVGKTGGQWDEYFTCLVASKGYIKSGHGFDAVVELEQIIDWIVSADPTRAEFKKGMIERAIKKASMTGVKVPDEAMATFRRRHYELFEEFFKNQIHDFTLRKPGPTWSGDCWFEIRNRLLPHGAYINQKADRGFIDLTFPDTDASHLGGAKVFLEYGMEIEQTHKSAAIRVKVANIRNFRSFDEERAKVLEGFSAVTRLLNFYIRERGQLEPILLGAQTPLEKTPPTSKPATINP